jgi:PAS domain S-box-containing protein
MVVDDEVIISAHLERRLKYMGYDVVGRANSGERSIDMAECLRPDLILMDIVMPGAMDGIDAAGKIRERMDIPVIFMTAYADDHYVSRAKQVDPYGYILKPFQEDQVRVAIEVALSRKEVERDVSRHAEQLCTLMDTFNDAVVSLDDAGRVIFWNRKATGLLGYTGEEMMGKSFTPLFSEGARKCLEEVLAGERPGAECGEKWTDIGRCRGKRKDGGEVALRVTPSVYWVRNERFITCTMREADRYSAGGEAIIPICSYCSKIRDERGTWHNLSDYLHRRMDIMLSHGICPSCMESLFANLKERE